MNYKKVLSINDRRPVTGKPPHASAKEMFLDEREEQRTHEAEQETAAYEARLRDRTKRRL